jgi:hypothetical protein
MALPGKSSLEFITIAGESHPVKGEFLSFADCVGVLVEIPYQAKKQMEFRGEVVPGSSTGHLMLCNIGGFLVVGKKEEMQAVSSIIIRGSVGCTSPRVRSSISPRRPHAPGHVGENAPLTAHEETSICGGRCAGLARGRRSSDAGVEQQRSSQPHRKRKIFS